MSEPRQHKKPRDAILEALDASTENVKARALKALREKRFDLAEQMLHADDMSTHTLVENLRVYQAELEIQNEELMLSHTEVQEALMRFSALFQGLPVAGLVIDRQGLVKESNSAAQRLFNLGASHFRQHFFARMIGTADRDNVISAWSELADGRSAWSRLGDDRSATLEGIHFNNGTDAGFLGDLHIAPLPGARDGLPQFVCAVIDRSETIRQHHELIETSARLRHSEATLKERLEELSALHDVLIETSQADQPIETVLQRVVERLPTAWQFPELAEAVIRLPDASFQTQGFQTTPWSQSTRFPLDAGHEGEIRVAYRNPPFDAEMPCFLDEEQALLDTVGRHVAVFITRHQDEVKLRESIENYRVLAEHNPEWEFWLDPKGHHRYVSPACSLVSGHDAEDFLSDPSLIRQLMHPDDLAAWDQHVADCKTQKAAPHETSPMQLRILKDTGEVRWIEHICKAVTTEDGRYLGQRGVNRDITERKTFQDALERSQELLSATGRLAKVGGWEFYPSSRRLNLTEVAREIFGIESARIAALADLLPHFDERDQPKLRSATRHALTQARPYNLEVRLAQSGNGQSWIQLTCQPVVCDGRLDRLVGAVQDITTRVEAEKSLRQAARVFESTAEGVVITDPDERILAVNKAFTEITGYSEEEVLGETPRLLKSGRHPAPFYEAMWKEIKETGSWRGEIWNTHKNGEVYPELMTISAVLDGADETTQYVGVFRDITHIKRSEEQLAFLAHHDPLTGLPNRSLFQLRLEHCVQRASRYQRKAALLFIDLDRFKIVNDTLGHLFGDALLKRTAESLAIEVRAEDTIARLGGDEFVILLEEVGSADDAAVFAERVLHIFTQPFRVHDRDLFVTASIGVSIYPKDGEDIETLLRHADIAMYRAKAMGRNAFALFEPSMAEGAEDRLRLETDLRGAIERAELAVHYQPQIALANGRLIGVEALCRWRHPQLGSIPPSRFIPLAEEIGVIDQLGTWVLEESCRQLAAWDWQGFRIPRLAVNLSVHQLEGTRLVDRVRAVLDATGVTPERLELEVTESTIMRHPERAVDALQALRALGITLAVDDFGTGYSSLAYLKRLPLNRLKINRSFVEHLTQDGNDDAIVRAIIALSDSLELATIAEGVETTDQADFLRRAGCLEVQGFLFGRPLASEELAAAWA
ncbi:EAL domain-containing protein [Thiorhodococcus mannitoliphagus]|uniref:cyclic-guanylate-specific phosphodiesterase n=1 Tax=Thiorhodococcus mannitoliphagus TaxID=329406 RepID=A0A6P1E0D5_9GAMM|nr:EAL domain-containing protein [Thiorhodococcus mannitoliphagus]NEX21902.1 EAL domain-containing protein [Thiorhodococcus mannitoliphagus]